MNPASVLAFEAEKRVLSILEKYGITRNYENGECRMTGNKQRLDKTTEGKVICLGSADEDIMLKILDIPSPWRIIAMEIGFYKETEIAVTDPSAGRSDSR